MCPVTQRRQRTHNRRQEDAPRICVPRFGAGSILIYRTRSMPHTLYQEGVRRGVIPARRYAQWRLAGWDRIRHMLNNYYKLAPLLAVLFCLACNKGTQPSREKYPPDNHELVTITQGIWGNVWFWEGNFQPFGWGNITPVQRTIYFYQLTRYDSVEPATGTWYVRVHSLVVDSAISGTNGFYQITMPPGEYSVFVREDTLYYANWFTIRDSTWYILPVPVWKDSVTKFQIDLTYKAAF